MRARLHRLLLALLPLGVAVAIVLDVALICGVRP